ncbi:hypothetical protein BT96DRAFT_980895 [Gymnopus androsaceus JB14]|uniref:Uncharacterized protein n=1 Tax=Gymnopus androsaceus JB14 TaxID=1447944 RepID=A0A6A4GT85_9AGAR|nr:hypothetical protein BT96DRAFT_980895 [Gymnopus androsaceus JB14]
MSSPAQAGYIVVEYDLFDIFFESMLYGGYCLLAITSIWIIARKGLSNGRIFMLAAIVIMFSSCTVALVMGQVRVVWDARTVFFPERVTPESTFKYNLLNAGGLCVVRVNYVLSDVIVVWRAWIIWGRNRIILAVLSLFLLGSIAAAGTDAGLSLSELFGKDVNLDNEDATQTGERALILSLPTLATNIFSMCLIVYKAWLHRRIIKVELDDGDFVSRVVIVLSWLIESAVIYCLLWGIYIIAFFSLFTRVGLDVMDTSMVQIAGIYPTVIIVLIALNKSGCERYSMYDVNSICFASASATVPVSTFQSTGPGTCTSESDINPYLEADTTRDESASALSHPAVTEKPTVLPLFIRPN